MEGPIELQSIHHRPASNSKEVVAELKTTEPEPYNPSKRQILLCRIQTAALCLAVFAAGWNDGTVGPLLPRIQETYHLGYLVAALLFVFQSLGSIVGAFITISLTSRLGFGKLLLLGPVFQLVGYSLQASALPFPVFCLSCAFNGVGVSIIDAQGNGYAASFARNAEARMGYVQAAYGAGIFAAPLVSTQFAQMRHWSFHYLVSLGITLLNMIVQYAVFRAKTQDECLAELGQPPVSKGTNEKSEMRQVLSLKSLHLIALFLFVHVGVGVAISGWTVTFMVTVRGGGASSGYIAAGYAGGVVLGRLLLIWVNKKIGNNLSVYIYSVIAIGLQLVVWLVPSLISGAVSVAFIGLLSGPIYPLALNRAAKIFPPWLLTGTMSWMAAMATVGGAIVPFIAGAISSRAGIKSLQPLILGMMVAMLFLWMLVPRNGHSLRGD